MRTSTATWLAKVHRTSWQPGTHHSPFSTFSRCNAWRETRLGDKGAAQKRNSEERQAWETTRRWQPTEWRSWRKTSLGDKVAVAAKSSPEGTLWRETSLGDKAAQKEIMKGNQLGRQGGKQQPRPGSGSQEQPRMKIIKGDTAWETRQQRQDFPSATR